MEVGVEDMCVCVCVYLKIKVQYLIFTSYPLGKK